MIKAHNGSAVPRHQVFVLDDGSFVVQWTDASVQDLLTGKYRDYKPVDFGHRVANDELERLKDGSVIEDFDHAYVWIYALPEQQRFGSVQTQQQSLQRARAYYVNTTLAADRLEDVQAQLEAVKLSGEYCVCEHDGLVAVLGRDAEPYSSLRDAENAQRSLNQQFPTLLQNAVVAFTESAGDLAEQGDEDEFIDLDALIASQTDTTITEGKVAVVACKDDAERQAILDLLKAMKMEASGVRTAQAALNLLEEAPADVFVMDLQFDDMHGWAMLGKIREMEHAQATRIIALAEPDVGDQVFALTVAKVDVYLRKPVSIARLRQSVWSTLKAHASL